MWRQKSRPLPPPGVKPDQEAYIAWLPLLPVHNHVPLPGINITAPGVLNASRTLSTDTDSRCSVWGLSAMLAFFWPALPLLGGFGMCLMGRWGCGGAGSHRFLF